jgi:inner membrane protein
MLARTHIVITIFFILSLINYVGIKDKWVFVLVALIATLIPDIDSKFSAFGKKKSFRIVQALIKHRGIMHSFTFLFFIMVILLIFWRFLAFGFFLGYSSHLIADCFTLSGIKPLYPWKKKLKWRVKTGGRIETAVFVLFLLWVVGLILSNLINYF